MDQNVQLGQRKLENCAQEVEVEEEEASIPTAPSEHQWIINWPILVLFALSHGGALIGVVLAVLYAQIRTLLFYFILIQFGATGIICGAHRLWTHRTFKASLPLRIFLMICQTLALQYSIHDWSVTHRVHHKFSDTDADPHNAKRGFFFSHMGWIIVEPHPASVAKRKTIDVSDLKNDPVVAFQRKFYVPLVVLITFVLPTLAPWYLWNESLLVAFFLNIFRHNLSVHQTSLVNSAAHIFGTKPYDTRIKPTEHWFTTFVTMGEAYHNYHHAFPFDYSASEFAWDVNYNPMTAFIDLCAALGLAWDRKQANRKLVEERIRKYGNADQLEVLTRQPKSVLVDTAIGVFWLLWALWTILVLKFLVYLAF